MRHLDLVVTAVLALALSACGGRQGSAEDPAEAWSDSQAAPWHGGVAPSGAAALGPPQRGRASYYSDKLTGRKTASGERYDPRALTAAHRSLPFGTVVEVARADGSWVRVRINDRGPFTRGRIVDLSRAAAEEVGLIRPGVADVSVWVVERPAPKAK